MSLPAVPDSQTPQARPLCMHQSALPKLPQGSAEGVKGGLFCTLHPSKPLHSLAATSESFLLLCLFIHWSQRYSSLRWLEHQVMTLGIFCPAIEKRWEERSLYPCSLEKSKNWENLPLHFLLVERWEYKEMYWARKPSTRVGKKAESRK